MWPPRSHRYEKPNYTQPQAHPFFDSCHSAFAPAAICNIAQKRPTCCDTAYSSRYCTQKHTDLMTQFTHQGTHTHQNRLQRHICEMSVLGFSRVRSVLLMERHPSRQMRQGHSTSNHLLYMTIPKSGNTHPRTCCQNPFRICVGALRCE